MFMRVSPFSDAETDLRKLSALRKLIPPPLLPIALAT